MNILVTGGAGYIGTRLVPYLMDAGHVVTVLDKLVFGAEPMQSFASVGNIHRNFSHLKMKDIRQVDQKDMVDANGKPYDAVIHLAGLSNDPTAEFNPEANLDINVHGTEVVVAAAKAAGVGRLVFASSCSVYYSMSPDDSFLTEDHAVDPRAPYSRSKREAEKVVVAAAGDGFSPVCLRKGTVYGQSPRMRYDLIVNTFVRDAFADRRLNVHCGGRMWRPLLSIDDACFAYKHAVEAPPEQVSGKILNVLSENERVIDVARRVRGILEERFGVKIELNVQEVGASRSYRVDGSRAKGAIGYYPSAGQFTKEVVSMWEALEHGADPDAPIHYNLRWLEMCEDMSARLKLMGGGAL